MLITHTLTHGLQSFLFSSVALTVSTNISMAFKIENRKPLNQSVRLYNMFYIKLYNDKHNAQILNFFVNLLLPYVFRAFF
jgi:hypothetical protein